MTRPAWNVHYVLFSLFAGTVLSIPCGLLREALWKSYAPPPWTADIYMLCLVFSIVMLPFWSCITFKVLRSVWWFGMLLSLGLFYLALLPAT